MRFLSRAAFVVFVGLAVLTGYFTWREQRTVAELGRLVDPVPRISGVTYVPTPAEIRSIAAGAAAVPGRGKYGLGSTQEERRRLAQEVRGLERRVWKLETGLSVAEVAAFYREARHRPGWRLATDEPPWLHLEREDESLTIFLNRNGTSGQTEVLYLHTPPPGPTGE